MRRVIMILAIVVALCLPAQAEEPVLRTDIELGEAKQVVLPEFVTDGKGWYKVTDKGATVEAVSPKAVPYPIRHPKIYPWLTAARNIGHTLEHPLIRFAANAALFFEELCD